MGMFDYVRYTHPMPNGEVLNGTNESQLYQIKDMECDLNVYDVTPEGQLKTIKNRWDRNTSNLQNEEWVDFSYTGEMTLAGGTECLHRLTFVDGKLTDVRTLAADDYS
jgi:hypothetical protein